MRYSLAAIFAAFAVSLITIPTHAQAQGREFPYCIRHWGEAGPGNCRFTTFRQCMATASGLNANCFRNPRLARGQQRRMQRF
jgi:hypothetical protein